MELSLDSASELASIALSRNGEVVTENTWRCHRNHTVELLPAVDKLLADAGVSTRDLTAVFVCTGPGMYTGLRVGVTDAKAFAHACNIPIVGVGRLLLDAYPFRNDPSPIVAIHKAGRGELAWACYAGDPPQELIAPRLSRPASLADDVKRASIAVGEIDDDLQAILSGSPITVRSTEPIGRAPALAALGHARLAAGQADEAALLAPIYLRPPAIGPQAPSASGG